MTKRALRRSRLAHAQVALGAACATLLTLPRAAHAEDPQSWADQGSEALKAADKHSQQRNTAARNVILFVGDGMGISTITAARILSGQQKGKPGEESSLTFEAFPNLALVKTYSINQQTSDSAPTMTAMVTGVKTKDGILSIDKDVVRGKQETVAGNEVESILELAEKKHLSTGVVSTARITHATPAACYAHSPDRDWEADSNIPEEQRNAGAKDIARQLIEQPGDGLEVALGGGRSYFLPETQADPEDEGEKGLRLDGRDLTAEWASTEGSKYVWNKEQFDAIDPSKTKRLLGLFERSHLEYEVDRKNDTAGEPSLSELTSKAIDILGQNDKGYFLMVEGGRIDHAHHAGNAHRALTDAIALSEAVKTALDKVDLEKTLVIVTADHSHVFTIGGYPTRGNDILGKVVSNDEHGERADEYSLDDDGLPYTTLSYANGPGYRGPNARPDLTDIDTTEVDFLQEALVPLSSETHAGEDVAVFAVGPSSHLVRGVQEQTISYYVMTHALGLR
jgi:alkaline phosphatase